MSLITPTEVRPAILRDAKSIADIRTRSSQAAFKAVFPGETVPWAAHPEHSLVYWREAIEYSEPQVLVAVQKSTRGGFCRLRPLARPQDAQHHGRDLGAVCAA